MGTRVETQRATQWGHSGKIFVRVRAKTHAAARMRIRATIYKTFAPGMVDRLTSCVGLTVLVTHPIYSVGATLS